MSLLRIKTMMMMVMVIMMMMTMTTVTAMTGVIGFKGESSKCPTIITFVFLRPENVNYLINSSGRSSQAETRLEQSGLMEDSVGMATPERRIASTVDRHWAVLGVDIPTGTTGRERHHWDHWE